MLIRLSKAAALNGRVGTVAIALEGMALNDSCFIPTWRWNEYKNRECPALFFVPGFWSWGRHAGGPPEGRGCSEALFLTPERLLPGPNMTDTRGQEIEFQETETGGPL